MELNANMQANVFQNISLNGHGGEFTWSLYHRARTGGTEQVEILIGDSENTAIVQKLITGVNGTWTQHTGSYTIPFGQTNLYIGLHSLNSGGKGNLMDNVVLTFTEYCGDSDGDGIIDKFDIDSDNDGITDIVESGGTDINGDGLVDNFTDTDNDGLHDPYDADNGGTTVVPTDTDTDGVADYLDLDADNDGIYDVVEGGDGASDTNNDGVVDSNDTGFADANSNGMADNTESTTAPDSDTDGIADYLELDSDGDGCNDVAEAGYTDVNGDGILGAASPTINTNGTVDTTGTSSGGYNTPADIDGNTVADYTEVGPNNASAETLTACDSLVWNGTTYTTSGTYTYTTTNMSGCDSVITLTLTITPSDDATFSYDTTVYCNSGTDPTPTITGTTGGTFSSPSGLVIDANTGSIDLSQSFIASSQGLIGYYSFSGNANDLSGNSNNGVVNGAQLVNDRFGNPNSSYQFDGIDDYIELTCLLYTSPSPRD